VELAIVFVNLKSKTSEEVLYGWGCWEYPRRSAVLLS
jgi:hypothetical protein